MHQDPTGGAGESGLSTRGGRRALRSGGGAFLVHVGEDSVRVFSRDGLRFEVHPLDPETSVDQHATSEVEMGRGRSLIARPDGIALAVATHDEAVEVEEIWGEVEGPPPFVEIEVDPTSWRTDDPWLREAMAKRAAESTWGRVVAAGMFLRFGADRLSRDEVRQATEAILRGESPSVFQQALAWLESLGTEELDTIEDLASGEVLALHDWVTTFDCDFSEQALEDLRELCHRRDDVEAVRLMLKRRGRDGLDHLLADLDRDAFVVTVALPPGLLRDERLERVAVTDWQAWWVRAVLEHFEGV